MTLSRRDFLRIGAFAGVAAAAKIWVPGQKLISIPQKIVSFDPVGIDDVGGGWFRCWINSNASYLKAGETDNMLQMKHGTTTAVFDLKRGTLLSVVKSHHRASQ